MRDHREGGYPFCHKIALVDLKQDEVVRKYGEMIGKTLRP